LYRLQQPLLKPTICSWADSQGGIGVIDHDILNGRDRAITREQAIWEVPSLRQSGVSMATAPAACGRRRL